MSFPKAEGQCPIYYNANRTGRPKWDDNADIGYISRYIDVSNYPLYPFGYGLSYTTYEYGKPTLSKDKIKKNESVTISFDLTNTGKMDGTEIVQLYIRDEYGSIARPVKELKDFQRVTLKAGETKKVEFTITPDDLKFYTIRKVWEVEPGDFTIMVGASSADKDLQGVALKVE
jgi:beta-glucosidase